MREITQSPDQEQLEAMVVNRCAQLFDQFSPTVLVTVKRLAREIFRNIPATELVQSDFWSNAFRAQHLVIAEMLRRLRQHVIREQDLIQAIEKATQLEIEGQLISRLTLERLLASLMLQDPNCVRVLIMKHAFELTYDEIGRATDLSVQQIRTLLAKAVGFVQQCATAS